MLFATGTDEHGNKSVLEAAKAGLPTEEYVGQMAAAYQEAWERMHITYDRFIRTSEEEHVRVVQDVFARLLASDDIYLGEYEGWYCVPCETYLLEADIVDGACPDCGREVKRVAEPTYFFRTSRYADRLLHYIEDNEHFVMPDGARKEVLAFIRQGLRDACISRARTDWDIPVPGDDTQSIDRAGPSNTGTASLSRPHAGSSTAPDWHANCNSTLGCPNQGPDRRTPTGAPPLGRQHPRIRSVVP